MRTRIRIGQHIVVTDIQNIDVGLGLDPGHNLGQVLLKQPGHRSTVHRVSWLSAVDQHRVLRGQDLCHRPPHKDQLVPDVCRQVYQQRRYHLDRTSLGVPQPRLIVIDRFDLLEFIVASGIVIIRDPDRVG